MSVHDIEIEDSYGFIWKMEVECEKGDPGNMNGHPDTRYPEEGDYCEILKVYCITHPDSEDIVVTVKGDVTKAALAVGIDSSDIIGMVLEDADDEPPDIDYHDDDDGRWD
jgi:hypothetical protein